MVDKINPDEMTSSQYGEALLQRKFKRQEDMYKRQKKDRRKDMAWALLGGIDTIMTNRAREEMLERDRQLDHLIIKEKAEYNRLQKEYDSQEAWRKASSPEAHAAKLAKEELGEFLDGRNVKDDDPLKIEYDKHLKELTNFHLDRYRRNKITLPFDTAEEYVSALTAMKGKKVPGGLLNWVAEKVGFRDAQEEWDIKKETSGYAGELRDRPGVVGASSKNTTMNPDLLNAMIRSDRYRPETGTIEKLESFTINNKSNTAKVIYEKEGNNQVIKGYEFVGKGFIDEDSLYIPDRGEIESRLAAWRSKNVEEIEGKTQKEVMAMIREDNKSLYSQIIGHNLYNPVVGTSDEVSALKTFVAGAVSDLITSPESFTGFSAEDERVRALKHFTEQRPEQLNAFVLAVAQSTQYYQKNGFKDSDGNIIVDTRDRAVAMRVALGEQLEGLELPGKAGWLGSDIGKFTVQPVGSAQPRSVVKGGKPSNAEEAQRLFDRADSQQRFKELSIPERQARVKEIEKEFNMTLDVDPELLEPNALDEEEEKETLSIEDVSEKYKISEELVNTLISKKPKRGPVEVQRPFREDPIDLITDQMLADSGYIDSIYEGALLKSLAKRKFIKDFYNDLGN